MTFLVFGLSEVLSCSIVGASSLFIYNQQTLRVLWLSMYMIWPLITYSICRDNPNSAYAVSTFPPTGYQPVVMIAKSHAF